MCKCKNLKLFALSFVILSIVANAQSTRMVDFAKKIEESTPAVLPQTPIVEKLKSDAADNNLKGKVKSVIEEIQYTDDKSMKRNSEDYYNESGNYLRTVSYTDGYPESVSVWGFIDGKRVNKSNSIKYSEGERPPSGDIIASVEDNVKNLDAPKDVRYSTSHKYRYNEQGQLVEEWHYANNGELWSRTVYTYKGNKKVEFNYGQDSSLWSQTIYILDKDGNMIERHLTGENGKVEEMEAYTYEFDAKGNWIVQKAFNKNIVKGKTILKPWFTVRRTITYYP